MANSTLLHRLADRLAHVGWVVLLLSVGFGVVGGAVVAVWNPDTAPPPRQAEECANPPCFGGGGAPRLEDMPAVVPILGSALAVLLGVPSALRGVSAIARGRWSHGLRRLLVVVGPVLLIVGMEIVPHVINPCLVADLRGGELPVFCERTESGADIADRLHALYHAVVGAIPMLAIYGWALHRWQPNVLPHRWRVRPQNG